MIARLRGKLAEKLPNSVLIDVQGVGYAAAVPVSTFSALPDVGAEATLFIHTHVREDALALYGFATRREKGLFEKLITVGGVGPRLALAVLSGLPTEELLGAIRAGDANRLVRIPGVGRKTGERIILELREKLGPVEGAEPGASAPPRGLQADVISALVNLGCTADAAEKAVAEARKQGTAEEFEPLFRRSLELIRR